MDSDLPTVRTEIKAWERNFRLSNGRHPSVQDIRDQPQIEHKYKRYKKLSKIAASSSVSIVNSIANLGTTNPPSTPPRSSHPRDKLALILFKPRVVETTTPLSGFNPFSPTKNKGKQKETTRYLQDTRSNPFATPAKGKAKAHAASPDPFPVIPQVSTSIFQPCPPSLNSAVARARKRLRGDPVSPSPNKQKRRRVGSQTSLPFSKLDLKPPTGKDKSDEEVVPDADSSFVDDSPVKAPSGGKPFKILFEESIPSSQGTSAKRRNTHAGGALFKEWSESVAGVGWEEGKSSNNDIRKKISDGKSFARRLLPEKSKLFPQDDSKSTSTAIYPANRGCSKPVESERRTSSKRFLSDTETDSDPFLNGTLNSQPVLLPPSPPPADISNRYNSKTKGKGKETTKGASRKKAKVDNDEHGAEETSETSEDDKVKVRLVDLSRRWQHGANDEDDFERDPILTWHHTHVPSNDVIQEGTFEVVLPDKLLSVLALSPSKSRSSKEERVVFDLLHGHGKSNHRGSEVWGVGDDIGRYGGGDTEGEDDWEGEGVPWEVGEM